MMQSTRIPALIAVLVGVLALGSFQGQHIDRLRDSESFYRWILSAAVQYGVDGFVVDPEILVDNPGYRDEQLFAAVQEEMGPELPEVALSEEQGASLKQADSKLVRCVHADQYDQEIWKLANSAKLDDERSMFYELKRNGALYSTSGEFTVETLYSNPNAPPSLGNIFFGFRMMAANLLWLQADKHFHEGEWFRVLPIIDTVVTLDPHFVDAYLIGAWHYAYNATAKMSDTPEEDKVWSEEHQAFVGPKERYYYEAVDLLKKGVRNNPRNSNLYFDLGFGVYYEKIEDYENAVRYLQEAIRYPHEIYMPRMLYRAMMDNGQYQEAIEGWEHYLANYDAQNPVAPRFIMYNKALIQKREATEHREKADEFKEELEQAQEAAEQAANRAERLRQQGDAEAAQEAEAAAREAQRVAAQKQAELESEQQLADEHMAKSIELWEEVQEEFGGDAFAESHLKRIEAMELVEEGRHWEAIALLDNARWSTGEFFNELSNMIIEIKKDAGIRLTLSEQKQDLRLQAAKEASERREAMLEQLRERQQQNL